MNYKALETSKTQWFSHLKDRMAQEQVIQEGLEVSEQFTQTYYSIHRLVGAFQKRNYQAFLEALSEVEKVSPHLTQAVKTFIKNKHLLKIWTQETSQMAQ